MEDCLGPPKFFPVMEPVFGGKEEQYLLDAFRSTWISSIGKYIDLFEGRFAEYVGAEYAIAVVNGTAALHLALAAMDVGEGDEVIVPDFTFSATANSVIYTGAKPILVDVDPETYTLDWRLLERSITKKTKAIIPVHLLGRPCEMDSILYIADKYGLKVVEDAAEAHGASYKGKLVGILGDIGCFSFFGNKIITTGEGGMCITNDPHLAAKMRILRDHGMNPKKRYWNDHVGFNYRMTNIQAAIGLGQIEQIETFIQQKMEMAKAYTRLLDKIPGVIPPDCKAWDEGVCWLFYVFLNNQVLIDNRDQIIMKMAERGVQTRPLFYPLHLMPPYRSTGDFPVTDKVSKAGIFLPSSVKLTEEDIAHICNIFSDVINEICES